MKQIVKSAGIPDKSIIAGGFGKVDYCDSYCIVKPTDETADEITTRIFKVPRWVAGLMKFRNAIVGIFGLRTNGSEETAASGYYPVGSKAGYFTVTERNGDEIVMGEDDRHLYFRASVLIDREESFIHLTTIVKFHNV